MSDVVEELRVALTRILPRDAQVLIQRLIEPRDRASAAEFYGVRPEAWDVLFFRAARAFAAARSSAAEPKPLPAADERARAAALEATLASGAPGDEIVEACRLLRAHGSAVKFRLAEYEAAEARSPAARRELWVRRALVLLIVGLSLYFYFFRPPPG